MIRLTLHEQFHVVYVLVRVRKDYMIRQRHVIDGFLRRKDCQLLPVLILSDQYIVTQPYIICVYAGFNTGRRQTLI